MKHLLLEDFILGLKADIYAVRDTKTHTMYMVESVDELIDSTLATYTVDYAKNDTFNGKSVITLWVY